VTPLRETALAFRFLTRIPVPGAAMGTAGLGRALAWFPVPGLALGILLAGAARVADGHLAPLVTSALLVALLAWLTGGLHLDGLADVADGLGGSRGDAERALAIMRDSRIGAHGASAVTLLLGAKLAAVAQLAGADGTWALVGAPAVSRFAVVPLVVLFPYARPQGLGKAFHEGGGPRELALAAAIAAAVVAALGLRALAPTAAAVAAALG
jgi:adenosylcobinamide-GDP ribazoletransferase